MKRLDIFKSEGGYRLALAVYLDSPVLDYSPWFQTKEEAELARENCMYKEERQQWIDGLVELSDIVTLKISNNYISIGEYAKLVAKDPSRCRRKAENGDFKTARKIGRNWIIDKSEPYSDNRRK